LARWRGDHLRGSETGEGEKNGGVVMDVRPVHFQFEWWARTCLTPNLACLLLVGPYLLMPMLVSDTMSAANHIFLASLISLGMKVRVTFVWRNEVGQMTVRNHHSWVQLYMILQREGTS
jgi:hypothetical protein